MLSLSLAVLAVGFSAVTSARQCQNLTVPISISARNGVFNVTVPETNVDVTDFTLNLGQLGKNYSQATLTGYNTVSGNYDIAATYCTPDSGPGTTVQILTHGIGFDRSYWDFPANNYNYSYVEEAVDQYGFTTFAWDRLGIGMSSHGDPLNEIQAFLEVSALVALTQMLREGSISGISTKAEKTLHVGHSFGSQHSYALAAMYPDLSDGIALTGFSTNGSFVPYFLFGANLVQANGVAAFSSLPNGYFADGDVSAVQQNFFAPGDFDPAILQTAYATGQPVTIGELLSISGEIAYVNQFPKPVLIVTGERDIPYCGGNCYATGNPAIASIPAAAQMMFPNASPFETYIVPGAGHGLNLQYTHPTTYGTILNFFTQHGCSAK